jgi:hypothetical protein
MELFGTTLKICCSNCMVMGIRSIGEETFYGDDAMSSNCFSEVERWGRQTDYIFTAFRLRQSVQKSKGTSPTHFDTVSIAHCTVYKKSDIFLLGMTNYISVFVVTPAIISHWSYKGKNLTHLFNKLPHPFLHYLFGATKLLQSQDCQSLVPSKTLAWYRTIGTRRIHNSLIQKILIYLKILIKA